MAQAAKLRAEAPRLEERVLASVAMAGQDGDGLQVCLHKHVEGMVQLHEHNKVNWQARAAIIEHRVKCQPGKRVVSF